MPEMQIEGYDTLLKSPLALARRVEENLLTACPECSYLIHFENVVQCYNLTNLLEEAEGRLEHYEHIYPYIKEICRDQKINPSWYQALEKVLNYALSKGRGKRNALPRDVKDAWLTYIVLLSCSMIDKSMEVNSRKNLSRELRLNYEKLRLLRLMGNN